MRKEERKQGCEDEIWWSRSRFHCRHSSRTQDSELSGSQQSPVPATFTVLDPVTTLPSQVCLRVRECEACAATAGSYLGWEPANGLCLVEHQQLGSRRRDRFEDVQEEISHVDVVFLSVVHKLHLEGVNTHRNNSPPAAKNGASIQVHRGLSHIS